MTRGHPPSSASMFPATAAVDDSLPVFPEEEFAFGLELLVQGLSRVRDARGGITGAGNGRKRA